LYAGFWDRERIFYKHVRSHFDRFRLALNAAASLKGSVNKHFAIHLDFTLNAHRYSGACRHLITQL
ncbi:MAG: hypothetical protein ACLUGT_02420, partial [Lactobacillaceae bacterium]